MRRRERFGLEHRLDRLEGKRGDGMCICTNPVRMAWRQDERTVIEGGTRTCPDCGGELIVVVFAFNPFDEHAMHCTCPECTPAAKKKRTQARAKVYKAAPALAKAHLPDGTRDWSRLSGEELDEARDAIATAADLPGGPRRPKRPLPPAQKPQPVRASSTKGRTASQEPPSRLPSESPRVPVAPKSEHREEPPSKTEPPSEPSGREWESQRSRRGGSLTRGVIEQDF